jgi:DNA-binding Lrp family transcriptional regulator
MTPQHPPASRPSPADTSPLDPTDLTIALALDHDATATTVALAQRLHLARNTVQAHQRHLEEGDALYPYSSRVRPASVGRPVLAFVTLEISQGDIEQITAELSQMPEIIEMHAITGTGDVLAKVAACDLADLHQITRRLLDCTAVARTTTALSVLELIAPRMAPILRG